MYDHRMPICQFQWKCQKSVSLRMESMSPEQIKPSEDPLWGHNFAPKNWSRKSNTQWYYYGFSTRSCGLFQGWIRKLVIVALFQYFAPWTGIQWRTWSHFPSIHDVEDLINTTRLSHPVTYLTTIFSSYQFWL